MEAASKARVAIVDDRPLFRQGLAVALSREADIDVVGRIASAS
jgi:DNA-binding NarL/FixJ family response regulator